MKKITQIRSRIPIYPERMTRQDYIREAQQTALLIIGVALAAFGFAVFKAPYNLSGGGVTGISLIINHYTGWPVGTLYFLMNIPILIFGFRTLGRWPFVLRTGFASLLFAFLIDAFTLWLPEIMVPFPPAEDVLLSSIYGGIIGGIGGGIVYRTGSSMGGTGIIGRWLQLKKGQPLSQVYLYTDGAILLAMGLVFGWAVTLYGLLILFIAGIATDYTLEGPSSTRVVSIVTDKPEKIAQALISNLGRGVSYWEITGGYSGKHHYLLTCTLLRPQVTDMKRIVAKIDPKAFITIAVGHQAIGEGFTPLRGKGVRI